MRQRILVGVLLLITAAYAWGLGWIAWGFSRAGGAVGWGLAIAVAVLLVLTVWVTWREVLFGLEAGRLARLYTPVVAVGDRLGSAEAEIDREAVRAAAREEFEDARATIQDGAEDDWQAWFRLALAYDALRDRRNARMATRRAIDVSRL